MKMKARFPKLLTAGKRTLSVILTLLMVLSVMTISPLSISADVGNTVKFLSEDGNTEIGTVTITDKMTTFADVVAANNEVAKKETCVSQNNASNPYLTTVFAGWEDTTDGSTKVFTKSTPVSDITTDIIVKATYDNTVEVVTAYDFYVGLTSTPQKTYKMNGTSEMTFVTDSDGKRYFKVTNTGTGGSHHFAYVMYSSPNSFSGKKLILQGKNYITGTLRDTFLRAIKNTSGANDGQDNSTYRKNNIGTKPSKLAGVNDQAESFCAIVDAFTSTNNYGINIAPWSGQGPGKDSYMYIEYFAVAKNPNVAEYIDTAELDPSYDVTVKNPDDTTNEELSGRYLAGAVIEFPDPVQEGRNFIAYKDTTTGKFVSEHIVTAETTFELDVASVKIFSADEGTLEVLHSDTIATLTKETDSANKIDYYKYSLANGSAYQSSQQLIFDYRNNNSGLDYSSYPWVQYYYRSNSSKSTFSSSFSTTAYEGSVVHGSIYNGAVEPAWSQVITNPKNATTAWSKLTHKPSGFNNKKTNDALGASKFAPWAAATSGTLTQDEWFDLAYVAFFPIDAMARVFDYSKYINTASVKVYKSDDTENFETLFDGDVDKRNDFDLSSYNSDAVSKNTGYEFAGWVKVGDEANVISGEDIKSVTLTGDTEFRPVFTRNIQVKFYASAEAEEPFSIIETDNATVFEKIVAQANNAESYEVTDQNRVFAGWQDKNDSNKKYYKDSFVGETVEVIPSYAPAYIIPATELMAQEKGSITESHGPRALEVVDGVPVMRSTIDPTATTANGHRFMYKLNSGSIDISETTYVIVKKTKTLPGVQKTSFLRLIDSKGYYGDFGDDYVARYTDDSADGKSIAVYNNFPGYAETTTTGIRYAYYNGESIEAQHRDKLRTDIEYVAFVSDPKLAQYIDVTDFVSKVDVKVSIDGIVTSYGERWPGETVDLPNIDEKITVDGEEKILIGYKKDANGKFMRKFTVTSDMTDAIALTPVYRNVIDPTDEAYTTAAGNLDNLYAAASDGELNVVYIGGSITVGQGASARQGYAYKVTEAIEGISGINTVNAHYMGLGGTGSRLGAYRVAQNVVAKEPDLVIIDFAINDDYNKESDHKYYEYIIREIRKNCKRAEIVSIFTTDRARLITTNLANDYDQVEAQQAIADLYGVTTINVGKYLAATAGFEIDNSKISDDQWSLYFPLKGDGEYDPVHPNDIGHAIYAEAITAYLAGATQSAGAADWDIPEEFVNEKVEFFVANTVDISLFNGNNEGYTATGFTYKADATDGSAYNGKLVPITKNGDKTDYTGPWKLEFDFVGTELSVYMNSPNDAVQIKAQVKDKTDAVIKSESASQSGEEDKNGPKEFYPDLPYGKYHATIEFDKAPTNGQGNIIAILVGGEKKTYTITLDPTEGGQISMTGAEDSYRSDSIVKKVEPDENGDATITFYAKPEANYRLRNIYSVPSMASLTGQDDVAFTPKEDHKYTITFDKDTYADVNFMPEDIEFPVQLIAFIGAEGGGTINEDVYFEDYILPGDTTNLTANANTGYAFAYWQRISQDNNVQVLLDYNSTLAASPLGGSVYYQPVFVKEGTATTLYIRSDTNEILRIGEEPATDPEKSGWEFKGYDETEEKTLKEAVGESTATTLTIKKAVFEKSATTELIKVFDKDGNKVKLKGDVETINPVFGQTFDITATNGNENPVWTLKIGDGEAEIPVYSGNTFQFSYMFKQGTEVVITEGTNTEVATPASIMNIASWNGDGKANFTGIWSLPAGDDVTHIEHGVLMSNVQANLEDNALSTSIANNVLVGGNFNTNGIIVGKVNSAEPTTVYTISKSLAGTAAEKTWYGRAYLIYSTGEGDAATRYAVFANDIATVAQSAN